MRHYKRIYYKLLKAPGNPSKMVKCAPTLWSSSELMQLSFLIIVNYKFSFWDDRRAAAAPLC